MSAPFFAVDPRWWPSIADALPRPWPEDAVLADLRWYEDQVWCKARKRIPGRRVLAARWGWTDRSARDILRNEDWRDQNVDKRVPLVSRKRPARVPKASQERPAFESEAPETTEAPVPVASQERPASVPVASQKRPQARSTQHTTHSTHHKDNKGERDGPNLSTDSDPLARMAAVAWRKHYSEVMGYAYPVARGGLRKLLPTFRDMARQAGCTTDSTPDTVEGHRLDGAIKHYITQAKARTWWTQKNGDVAPDPGTALRKHWDVCLAAAPPMRCKCCKGTKRRTGAYLVSDGSAVDRHEFPCPECNAAGLAELVATLEGMGRREGETYWTHGILPHEPQHAAFVALVQTTLRGEA